MSNAAPEKMPTENEQIVNEILHDIHDSFAEISDGTVPLEVISRLAPILLYSSVTQII